TQTLLAEMLGVYRPTITNALREFEKAGLVAPGQRQIVVLNRKALLQASCECYQLVRERIAFHLPNTRNSPKKVALPVIYITDTPSMSDHNREGMEVGHNVKRQTFRP